MKRARPEIIEISRETGGMLQAGEQVRIAFSELRRSQHRYRVERSDDVIRLVNCGRDGHRPWTEAEEELLRVMAAQRSVRELADFMDRPLQTIYNKLKRLEG